MVLTNHLTRHLHNPYVEKNHQYPLHVWYLSHYHWDSDQIFIHLSPFPSFSHLSSSSSSIWHWEGTIMKVQYGFVYRHLHFRGLCEDMVKENEW